MSVNIYMNNGNMIKISKKHLINDIQFNENQEIVNYLLDTISNMKYIKINGPTPVKTIYISTSNISYIENHI